MIPRTDHAKDTGSTLVSEAMTPVQTARYTRELLDSLRKIAVRQDQLVLAGLLEAAAREAKRLMVV